MELLKNGIINGDQLQKELSASFLYVAGDVIYCDSSLDEYEAQSIVDKHVPIFAKENSLSEAKAALLEKLGITEEEVRLLLS